MDAETKLETILLKMNAHTLSKRVASKLVGGRGALYDLIVKGKIRVEKPNNVQNGKWHCNASDVLRHISSF